MGDRLFAEYQVINIQKDQGGRSPKHVTVGNYKYTNVRILSCIFGCCKVLSFFRTPPKWFFQSMMT